MEAFVALTLEDEGWLSRRPPSPRDAQDRSYRSGRVADARLEVVVVGAGRDKLVLATDQLHREVSAQDRTLQTTDYTADWDEPVNRAAEVVNKHLQNLHVSESNCFCLIVTHRLVILRCACIPQEGNVVPLS